jgi:hypothetical protein
LVDLLRRRCTVPYDLGSISSWPTDEEGTLSSSGSQRLDQAAYLGRIKDSSPDTLSCRCPVCQEPRFERYETLKGTSFRPRKALIEFGVEKAVRELWADPEFCKARNGGVGRDFKGTDFWGGEYAEEIKQSVGGLLFQDGNGGYELGFDYGQP